MTRRRTFHGFVALLALSAWATVGHAATIIPVPNGDFEDWEAIGTGTTGWANLGGQTAAQRRGTNREIWANPSSFGSGWTELNKTSLDGKYGLQHPNDAHHVKDAPANTLAAPFNGFFIGFANLTDGDGEGESLSQIQSEVLGNVQAGFYTLNVAFGNRRNTSWNDYHATISLLADGVPLGSESVTMIPSVVPTGAGVDQTLVDLQLVVTVGAGSADIGKELSILIETQNAGTRNGVATTLSTFTQANFDNVRLTYIPEPSALALLLGGAFGLAFAARRRT